MDAEGLILSKSADFYSIIVQFMVKLSSLESIGERTGIVPFVGGK